MTSTEQPQLDLGDVVRHRRNTDPSTSHIAAAESSRRRPEGMAQLLALVERHPGKTATEYAERIYLAAMSFDSRSNNAHRQFAAAIKAFRAANKRMSDLAATKRDCDGTDVEPRVRAGGKRVCQVTGREATVWYPV